MCSIQNTDVPNAHDECITFPNRKGNDSILLDK